MSILVSKETRTMKRLAAIVGFSVAALFAGPTVADPHDDAVFAEYQRICVQTHASRGAITAAMSGKGWQKGATAPSGMGPNAVQWGRSDATGQYVVAVGVQQVEPDLPPARLCVLTTKPPLSDAARALVTGWMDGMKPATDNATTLVYFFVEQNGQRSEMTRGDKAAARAALTNGSVRSVIMTAMGGTTKFAYMTSESPSN